MFSCPRSQAGIKNSVSGGAGSSLTVFGTDFEAESTGHLQDFRVSQGLLHAVTDRVMIVFGFHHGDGDTGFPVEYIVREFLLFLVATRQVAPDDNRAGGEGHLAPDLPNRVPSGALDGGGDEQIADVGFAAFLFVEFVQMMPLRCASQRLLCGAAGRSFII